jgi:hypothetical protein
MSSPAQRRAQTHCIHGHEFTPTNTSYWNGSRHCRACGLERNRKSRKLHPERGIAYTQRWRAKHPDYKKHYIGVCKRCKRELPIVSRGRCSTCSIIERKEMVKKELLFLQGARCAIVGCTTDTTKYKLKDWHLDHNHLCGGAGHWCKKCIRGVLCRGCNAAIGMTHESIETLRGIIAYLGGQP